MKKFKLLALLAATIFTLLHGGCSLTPVKARTIEEIRGTYELTQYYEMKVGNRIDNMQNIDYFYVIIGEREECYVICNVEGNVTAEKLMYTSQYSGGSTTMIEEIKFRFYMPGSSLGDDFRVNYFTVADDNTLVCQKIRYDQAIDSLGTGSRHVIQLSLKKVSHDYSFSYVNAAEGIDVEECIGN